MADQGFSRRGRQSQRWRRQPIILANFPSKLGPRWQSTYVNRNLAETYTTIIRFTGEFSETWGLHPYSFPCNFSRYLTNNKLVPPHMGFSSIWEIEDRCLVLVINFDTIDWILGYLFPNKFVDGSPLPWQIFIPNVLEIINQISSKLDVANSAPVWQNFVSDNLSLLTGSEFSFAVGDFLFP